MIEDKRKNYFIKKEFQIRFILKFCALVVMGAIFSGVILFSYVFYRGTVTTAFINSRLSIVTTADYILPVLMIASLAAIILIGLVTVITVMYLSHRIAGPLFRIEKSLEEISSGNLGLKINLRATDEIQRMAGKINEMTSNLNLHFNGIKSSWEQIDREMDVLLQAISKEGAKSGEEQEAIDNIVACRQKMKEEIDYFRVG